MSFSGTFPGRKPGIFTLRASCFRRVSTSRSISAAGNDIADEGAAADDVRLSRLSVYRSELARIAVGEIPDAPLFGDVARIVREYDLPLGLFGDLVDAFAQDVAQKRYASFAQLLDYCRRSANPVGRLLLHLFKRTSETDLAA